MPRLPGVYQGAQLWCSCGSAPSTLLVVGARREANIADNRPLTNVLTFGVCNSMANPTVAAASAAAGGALVPMPCTPACAAFWAPGDPSHLIDQVPALTPMSNLMCQWGGVIRITNPGH